MQDSLYNTVQKLAVEEKVNVEELEIILNSSIEEVVKLCKKACLKPKTDSMGNAYFTKSDVDTLKKIKELYSKSKEIQEMNSTSVENKIELNEDKKSEEITNPDKKINFLTKAKNRIKSETVLPMSSSYPLFNLQAQMERFENNLVAKMSEILSEKMDGFDEIIVELIRAKTENENLRQQVNTLNKQVFILKGELASFNPLPFGLYTKKETDEL